MSQDQELLFRSIKGFLKEPQTLLLLEGTRENEEIDVEEKGDELVIKRRFPALSSKSAAILGRQPARFTELTIECKDNKIYLSGGISMLADIIYIDDNSVTFGRWGGNQKIEASDPGFFTVLIYSIQWTLKVTSMGGINFKRNMHDALRKYGEMQCSDGSSDSLENNSTTSPMKRSKKGILRRGLNLETLLTTFTSESAPNSKINSTNGPSGNENMLIGGTVPSTSISSNNTAADG